MSATPKRFGRSSDVANRKPYESSEKSTEVVNKSPCRVPSPQNSSSPPPQSASPRTLTLHDLKLPPFQTSSKENSTYIIGPGNRDQPGFPSYAQYEVLQNAYLNNLHKRKREKALITQSMHELIYDVLSDPGAINIGTAQFRHWVRRSFVLVEKAGCVVVTSGGRPVAVKEHIYEILCMCHAESGHKGRDKTCQVIREYYTWVPKDLVASFVKACPTCNAKRPHHTVQLTEFEKSLHNFDDKLPHGSGITHHHTRFSSLRSTLTSSNPHTELDAELQQIDSSLFSHARNDSNIPTLDACSVPDIRFSEQGDDCSTPPSLPVPAQTRKHTNERDAYASERLVSYSNDGWLISQPLYSTYRTETPTTPSGLADHPSMLMDPITHEPLPAMPDVDKKTANAPAMILIEGDTQHNLKQRRITRSISRKNAPTRLDLSSARTLEVTELPWRPRAVSSKYASTSNIASPSITSTASSCQESSFAPTGPVGLSSEDNSLISSAERLQLVSPTERRSFMEVVMIHNEAPVSS
ncbi:hypothetical protein BD410DRAFT_477709 [Rickenella mellea]|uniref:Integrase zinc-binding domain-containing protein n=1 Tax=Rickenella mellea TaxID=50990 RepID=A0A4Y7QJE2_9AGAM|nr:hypothetical protein BD410DRAFT_477709 [Rickenella mellea]